MLAFIHIEKCAGTTLVNLLRRNFGRDHFDVIPRDRGSMLFDAGDLRRLLRLRPRARSLAGHSLRPASRLEEAHPQVRYYTLLRDPAQRYISDFRHFVDILGYPADFPTWLAWQERHNFQTRAIAGGPDLELAKQVISERLALVGLVERFDDFLDRLRALAAPWPLDTRYQPTNTASQRTSPTAGMDFSQYAEAIADANRLDQALCEFVRDRLQELRPAGQPSPPAYISSLAGAGRSLANRVYRNLVYKPSTGRWAPGAHALPLYLPYDRQPRLPGPYGAGGPRRSGS